MVLTEGDGERMRFIETEVTKLVLPYRENTEAAIVIFALMNVARKLLRLYSKKSRDWILEDVCIPFMREAQRPGRLVDQPFDIKLLTKN